MKRNKDKIIELNLSYVFKKINDEWDTVWNMEWTDDSSEVAFCRLCFDEGMNEEVAWVIAWHAEQHGGEHRGWFTKPFSCVRKKNQIKVLKNKEDLFVNSVRLRRVIRENKKSKI